MNDYITDEPIYNVENDLLGRADFSNQLGNAIYQYNGKDGLVIGLFGKWGTGKTSVINMAENKINELAKNSENKPIIIRFNPWNYSDNSNLISLFFKALKNNLGLKKDKSLWEALSKYSYALDWFEYMPSVGKLAPVIRKVIEKQMKDEVDLDKTRQNLKTELEKANNKIIVLIDDIDRLINSQIRDIFQLVKQVGNFPNIIYVLAMDREIICRALTDFHNIYGNEYLDKIIQVPLELPELSKLELNRIFFEKLKQIINSFSNDITLDKNYWNHILKKCIEPYINTLRDINRVINTFNFRYGMLYNEISFEDMIAITTIEVLEPKLYKWIYNNKNTVCGEIIHTLLSNIDNKQDYYKLYYDEFKNLGIDPDKAITFVSAIFPEFADNINENRHFSQTDTYMRSKMRIANEKIFGLYFMFNLTNIKISRVKINFCIKTYSEKQLIETIKKVNNDGHIVYFLEEIRALIYEIPYDRLNLIATVLLSLQSEFKGENLTNIFTLPVCNIAEALTIDIIKRLDTEKEKYNIIRSTLENSDKTKLGTIAKIIKKIELSHGRLGGIQENEKIINLESLKELENIYLTKIQTIVESEEIWYMKEFDTIFYLWKYFDKDKMLKYLKTLFENEINKLKFICEMAHNWIGSGNGWGFYSNEYSDYISPDEVYETINGFRNKIFDEFTETDQIKLASFILQYNKNEEHYIRELEARKLLNEWKTSKENQDN